jgi:hypothetical protein
MRKIDKTKILSTVYKNWEDNLVNTDQNHGKYNSSANEHYIDVVMNLLHVQNGLCAYTEMRLCNEDLIAEDKWEQGMYNNRNPQFNGQLDHFDPTLKEHKAWLWSNLFLIDSDINTKVKGKKEVDDILKPDTDAYNEEDLLEYICDKNIFIANTELATDIQERINNMIIKLGINFDPVTDKRRRYIADKIKQIEFEIEDWNSIEIDEFPTAFRMCRIQNQ